jgi:hypothetical protein
LFQRHEHIWHTQSTIGKLVLDLDSVSRLSLDLHWGTRVSVVINDDRRHDLPDLKVPERFIAGIVRIAEISQEGFDQLISALKTAPACKNSKELLAWIGNETPAITESDRKEIISAAVPMVRVQQNSGVSIEAFSSDVLDSIVESQPSIFQKITPDLLKSRTSQLITEPALDLASSRISEVKSEVERNFCKLKIMTDLRPAFRNNSEDVPLEMAAIHNFQIGYHDGMGKHHEFYLSLDAGDLETLKKAIAEAEKRVQTLERLLEKSGVSLHK